jgi:hypothetical protein
VSTSRLAMAEMKQLVQRLDWLGALMQCGNCLHTDPG